MKKLYELNDDYILEVLKEVEDKLSEELMNNIPKSMLFTFSKFLAVRNEIERINIRKALN